MCAWRCEIWFVLGPVGPGQGRRLRRAFKETAGFKYAGAGRSLPGRQGGKEKKGDLVRQAGMGGPFLPQMEHFDSAASKLVDDLIMPPCAAEHGL